MIESIHNASGLIAMILCLIKLFTPWKVEYKYHKTYDLMFWVFMASALIFLMTHMAIDP